MTPLTLLLSQTLGNKPAAAFLNKLLISKNKGATENTHFYAVPFGLHAKTILCKCTVDSDLEI